MYSVENDKMYSVENYKKYILAKFFNFAGSSWGFIAVLFQLFETDEFNAKEFIWVDSHVQSIKRMCDFGLIRVIFQRP